MDYLAKLREPFAPELISWRIGATNKDKTSAIALAYIDARDVRQRLNDVCGVAGWSSEHYDCGNGKLGCKLSVWIGGEWITKTDGAGDTNVEADKGAFSDSLKRSAVSWGVGEYLYDVKDTWVDIVPYGRSHKIKNKNDPKLAKALHDAANGIRYPAVDEPFKATPADEIKVKDLRWLIRECDNSVDLQAEMDKSKAVIEGLHEDLQSDIYEAENEVMGHIENHTFVQSNIYAYSNVEQGKAFLERVEDFIEGCSKKKMLEEWFDRWQGKLRALDTILSAKAYQTEEGSPYVRVQLMYNERIKELS